MTRPTILRLADLTTSIDYGLTASAVEGQGPRFLRITDLQDDSVNWSKVPSCICSERDLDKYELFDGDIVFARTGATTGKSYLIKSPPFKSIFASYLIRVRPNNKVNPSYLAHFFQSKNYWHQISSITEGAAQPGVNASKLANLKIPVPNLKEQKFINTLLDKADTIRKKRRKSLKLADEFLRSVFLEMFGDPVRNPKGWELVQLSDLCSIRRGASPRPINQFLDGTIPWIKIGDASSGDDIYIESTAEHVTEEGALKSVRLKPGSFVFANCGVSLGFARILKIEGCIHDGWLAFEDFSKEINQLYLLALINVLTPALRKMAPDGMQPNLNTGLMKNLKIPLPPIEFQEKFTPFLLKNRILKGNLQRSLAETDLLLGSLQSRFFS
jgi:type I restriction enzyme S subunit